MTRPNRQAQHGGFLLEALVGILIFTLGVLGLVALQARAIAYTGDAYQRGDAAFLANAYVSKMWADSRAQLPLRYIAPGQLEYDAFAQAVYAALPGAASIVGNPTVTIVTPGPGGTTDALGNASNIHLTGTGTVVQITLEWEPPGTEKSPAIRHRYVLTSIIAAN